MSSVESRQPPPEPPQLEAYRFLVDFAYRHLDFQMAELESVLRMNGVILGSEDCQIHTLLNQGVFLQSQKDFSRAGTVKQLSSDVRRPFVLLSIPGDGSFVKQHSDDPGEALAAMIISRCTLVRSVLELWAMAGSLEDCSAGVQQWTVRL
jgi:tRNA (guanine10-N2)-methyltransferase